MTRHLYELCSMYRIDFWVLLDFQKIKTAIPGMNNDSGTITAETLHIFINAMSWELCQQGEGGHGEEDEEGTLSYSCTPPSWTWGHNKERINCEVLVLENSKINQIRSYGICWSQNHKEEKKGMEVDPLWVDPPDNAAPYFEEF